MLVSFGFRPSWRVQWETSARDLAKYRSKDHLKWPCIEHARVYADPLEVLQIRYADAEARYIYLYIDIRILSYGFQGYDISDFHDIDPLFGSMQVRSVRHRLTFQSNPSESISTQDFKDLVAAAKEIGISLLMETRPHVEMWISVLRCFKSAWANLKRYPSQATLKKLILRHIEIDCTSDI